jgi:hypothetical protein
LGDDLRAGCPIMGFLVGWVVVLIRLVIAFRVFTQYFFDHADCSVYALEELGKTSSAPNAVIIFLHSTLSFSESAMFACAL